MVVGILLVLLAALASGAGSVLESQGAQRASPTVAAGRVGMGRLMRQPRYVLGLIVDGIGFLAAAVAMQYLPLFMVQAGVASSVGVTALLAVVLGATLPRRTVLTLGGMLIGLVLLFVSASTDPAVSLPWYWRWAIVAAVLPTAGVGWLALRVSDGRFRATLSALAAGLGFTWVAVAARTWDPVQTWWQFLIDPTVVAVVVNGVVATVCFAAALEHGSVTLVSAINYSTETVVPALIGLSFLGDRVRPGLAPIAVVGFVLAVGGALLLAGFSARLTGPPVAPSPGNETPPVPA